MLADSYIDIQYDELSILLILKIYYFHRTKCYLAGTKVECVFPMVAVTILPHAEFGPNDHREDVPHFTSRLEAQTVGLNFRL